MVNDKRALIFGATGHVGGAAARELLRRGWRVRAVSRNPGSEKALALAAWGVMPKVAGWDLHVPWASVADIGANMFEDPDRWIGRDLKTLVSDIKSLRECQATFVEVTGKKPFGVPLPNGLFRRMADEEFINMWRWMAEWDGMANLPALAEASREACPEPLDVASWLRNSRNGQGSQ